MTYIAVCPACSKTVRGGDICECGYLRLNVDGKTYTRRAEGHNWENAPNIPVRLEEIEPVVPRPSWEPEEEEEPPIKATKKERD